MVLDSWGWVLKCLLLVGKEWDGCIYTRLGAIHVRVKDEMSSGEHTIVLVMDSNFCANRYKGFWFLFIVGKVMVTWLQAFHQCNLSSNPTWKLASFLVSNNSNVKIVVRRCTILIMFSFIHTFILYLFLVIAPKLFVNYYGYFIGTNSSQKILQVSGNYL